MFVGRRRKVSTAGAVDLSAVSLLGGSGSRVVSMAKGFVARWRAECGRSDNSSRVNAIDSAGRTPKRVTVAKWSWRRTLAGRFGGSAAQKPLNFLLLAWTWIWVTSRPPLHLCGANCLKSRQLKFFGNEKVHQARRPRGSAPCRRGAGQES